MHLPGFARDKGHLLRVALVVGLLLFLSGCKGLRVEQLAPEVRISAAELEQADLLGGRLRILLDLRNPNPFPLEASRYDYRLELAGVPVAAGESVAGLSLPAGGSQRLPLVVDFRWQQLADGLQAVLRNRKAPYALRGRMRIGPFDVPFSGSGELAF
ncbi:MAG: hypothetical protein D6717_03450 [Gammaproteobacteria bacterium]|nr:MAG: hypothetical protein D6717_03450 [Gammaproteobacteria bacterium]